MEYLVALRAFAAFGPCHRLPQRLLGVAAPITYVAQVLPTAQTQAVQMMAGALIN